jgi:hypothetical protein
MATEKTVGTNNQSEGRGYEQHRRHHIRDQEHRVIWARGRREDDKARDERDVMSNVRSRGGLVGYTTRRLWRDLNGGTAANGSNG